MVYSQTSKASEHWHGHKDRQGLKSNLLELQLLLHTGAPVQWRFCLTAWLLHALAFDEAVYDGLPTVLHAQDSAW